MTIPCLDISKGSPMIFIHHRRTFHLYTYREQYNILL